VGISTTTVDHDVSMCIVPQEEKDTEPINLCNKQACLWNVEKKCSRGEILVDKLEVHGEPYWICRCYSNKSFSNHRDWTQNLNSDGTPKGGHVDDDYSEKMHHQDTVTKIFPDHMRQKGINSKRK
jgi:hypothetical protein